VAKIAAITLAIPDTYVDIEYKLHFSKPSTYSIKPMLSTAVLYRRPSNKEQSFFDTE
jgi:hypothetical protein